MTAPSSEAPNLATRRQQFDARGYVILHSVFAPAVVEGARRAMNQLVDNAAAQLMSEDIVTDTLKGDAFETRLASLYRNHMDKAPKSYRHELHLAELYDVFFNAHVLDVVEEFLGDEIRLYPNYTARPKFPDHAGSVVLWHQDGGYTEGISSQNGDVKVDDLRMINVWSPLVPARVENGCMQFVPQTHKLGVVPHEKKEHYLEISREHLQPREQQAINVELDPGDVVLFDNLLFHRGLPNLSQTIRWSLDWRYQDANQPTLRKENGHLARSKKTPQAVISSARQWAESTFS